MLDEKKLRDLLELIKNNEELTIFLSRLVLRAYPEIRPDDDVDYSDSEGSACSEEYFGYHKDDEGHISLK